MGGHDKDEDGAGAPVEHVKSGEAQWCAARRRVGAHAPLSTRARPQLLARSTTGLRRCARRGLRRAADRVTALANVQCLRAAAGSGGDCRQCGVLEGQPCAGRLSAARCCLESQSHTNVSAGLCASDSRDLSPCCCCFAPERQVLTLRLLLQASGASASSIRSEGA